jgi:hypothetical protein
MRIIPFVFAALLAIAMPARAQQQARPYEQVPINDLVSQTQKASPSAGTVDLVWWLPPAFWEVSLAHAPGVDDSMRKEIHDLFGKYAVVAAVKGAIGNFGVNSYLSEDELRGKLQLVAPDGSVHTPIATADLDPRLNVVVGVLKPVFQSMLGDLGKNLNFFAFPGEADGHAMVDPLGKGKMVVRLDGEDYDFRLPLDALLVPSQDPKTLEQFPGSYRFNPYTGAALRTTAPE